MHFVLYAVMQILFLFGSVRGIDPFEGDFPTFNCQKPRDITGCKETLLDAYSRTEESKSDQNRNPAVIRFLLYTCRNPNEPEFLHKCGGNLPNNTVYRRDDYTVFIVPGWLSHVCTMAFQREYKDQFLARGRYNVILVDWPCCNGLDYYTAAKNTKVVGNQIAYLIKTIMNVTGVTGEKFHCIGHSLGAHICGFAGKHFVNDKLRRITALDPAGPAFMDNSAKDRLNKTDAKYVDVFHTSAGHCLLYSLGLEEPLGHADFYPNGGTIQFSCYVYLVISLLKLDFYYAFLNFLGPFCPHFQSVQFFKVTINPCKCQCIGVECHSYADFKSGKCNSCGQDGSQCAVMGLDWENYPHKIDNEYHKYYLDTTLHCPYCNNDKIRLEGFSKTPIKGDKGNHCFNPENNTLYC